MASRYVDTVRPRSRAPTIHPQGKLEALKQRAQFMPTSPLADVTLQVCDISGDAGLEQRYGMLVPVLTWYASDGVAQPVACTSTHAPATRAADDADEVMIERPSPRVGAAQLERHLAKHIPQ